MDKPQKPSLTPLVFGVLLTAVGVLFTLDNFRVLEAGRPKDYWPLIIVGFGLAALLSPRDASDRAFGAAVLAMGGFFQLREWELISVPFRDFWPFLLVLAGIVLVVEAVHSARSGSRSSVNAGQN